MTLPSQTVPARTADGSGAMFDKVARRYDLLNRLMSLGLDLIWRKQLVDALDAHGAVRLLDVATGTADVALALARRLPQSTIVGLDPSLAMLGVGKQKVQKAALGERIELMAGDAQAMPFAMDTFDGACISFGIRNVPDRLQGLREMVRVCKPGSRVVVLELGEPQGGWLAPLVRFHVHQVVPFLGGLLSGAAEYRYLQRSIAAFPPPDVFAAMMREAGLDAVNYRRLSLGAVHLYWGRIPGR